MASEYKWRHDGGVFIARDEDGFNLVKEVDGVFNQTGMHPEKYMDIHYPDYPKDQLIPMSRACDSWAPNGGTDSLVAADGYSEEPEKLSRPEKISMITLLGGCAVAGATGVWSVLYIGRQIGDYIIPILRNLH